MPASNDSQAYNPTLEVAKDHARRNFPQEYAMYGGTIDQMLAASDPELVNSEAFIRHIVTNVSQLGRALPAYTQETRRATLHELGRDEVLPSLVATDTNREYISKLEALHITDRTVEDFLEAMNGADLKTGRKTMAQLKQEWLQSTNSYSPQDNVLARRHNYGVKPAR